MAGRGRMPKPLEARASKARLGTAPITLIRHGSEAPELPDHFNWHPQTISWWETWRRSEMASQFLETDWIFLIDTALLHHQIWAEGKTQLLAELRLRVAKFGCTVEDRAHLRMTFADANTKDPAGTAVSGPSSRDRFGSLMRAVGNDD